MGDFMVTGELIRRDFGVRDDLFEFVAVQPGRRPGGGPGAHRPGARAAVPRIAEAQNRQEFQDSITGQVDQFLFLIYALLSLSVIVSLFGIVNTLVLSIHERTREIGMMRAIGHHGAWCGGSSATSR